MLIGEEVFDSSLKGAMTGAVFGLTLVLIERLLRGFTLRVFSSATFGMLLGLVAAKLLLASDVLKYQRPDVEWSISLIVYVILGYIGMMLAMRSNRDEFALVIPYIRFHRHSIQDIPILLDTNIIIDGRISKICETGFLSSVIIVPDFVLHELQKLSDSHDPIKRSKGKRGLDHLNELRQSPAIELSIHESSLDTATPVDSRLLQLARVLQARLVSNDAPLCKIARLQGISTLSLNELSTALQPTLHPGDDIQITLSKPGKESHQSIAFLPDGTMVVVDNSSQLLGQQVSVTIKGATKTSAGQLFFADLTPPSA